MNYWDLCGHEENYQPESLKTTISGRKLPITSYQTSLSVNDSIALIIVNGDIILGIRSQKKKKTRMHKVLKNNDYTFHNTANDFDAHVYDALVPCTSHQA